MWFCMNHIFVKNVIFLYEFPKFRIFNDFDVEDFCWNSTYNLFDNFAAFKMTKNYPYISYIKVKTQNIEMVITSEQCRTFTFPKNPSNHSNWVFSTQDPPITFKVTKFQVCTYLCLDSVEENIEGMQNCITPQIRVKDLYMGLSSSISPV